MGMRQGSLHDQEEMMITTPQYSRKPDLCKPALALPEEYFLMHLEQWMRPDLPRIVVHDPKLWIESRVSALRLDWYDAL
jgi:hypothetical protein